MGMIPIAAFAAIATTTGLAEFIQISNRLAVHIALKFEQMWLSRYPRPLRSSMTKAMSSLVPTFKFIFTGWISNQSPPR